MDRINLHEPRTDKGVSLTKMLLGTLRYLSADRRRMYRPARRQAHLCHHLALPRCRSSIGCCSSLTKENIVALLPTKPSIITYRVTPWSCTTASLNSWPQEQIHASLRPFAACPARLESLLPWRARQAGGVGNSTVLLSSSSTDLLLWAMPSVALIMLSWLEQQLLVVLCNAWKAVPPRNAGNNVPSPPAL